MSFTVEDGGILTTVQDTGRSSFRHLGVPVCGAMDSLAARIANLMLANEVSSPLLEYTLTGPTLRFHADTVICLTGGTVTARLEDQPVPCYQPVVVQAGQMLKLGPIRQGCRGYLALKGGLHVDHIMKSASTYLRAGIGGFHGRSLAAGDNLTYIPYPLSPTRNFDWFPSQDLMYDTISRPVRIIPTTEHEQFSDDSCHTLFNQPFGIDNASDRMGYRLTGPTITRKDQTERLTQGVTIGTVQVPHDGHPIILMADSQPTGGYPVMGQVISVDIPRLAQMKPGDKLRFEPIELDDAQSLLRAQEQYLQRLSIAASYKWKDIVHA